MYPLTIYHIFVCDIFQRFSGKFAQISMITKPCHRLVESDTAASFPTMRNILANIHEKSIETITIQLLWWWSCFFCFFEYILSHFYCLLIPFLRHINNGNVVINTCFYLSTYSAAGIYLVETTSLWCELYFIHIVSHSVKYLVLLAFIESDIHLGMNFVNKVEPLKE